MLITNLERSNQSTPQQISDSTDRRRDAEPHLLGCAFRNTNSSFTNASEPDAVAAKRIIIDSYRLCCSEQFNENLKTQARENNSKLALFDVYFFLRYFPLLLESKNHFSSKYQPTPHIQRVTHIIWHTFSSCIFVSYSRYFIYLNLKSNRMQ